MKANTVKPQFYYQWGTEPKGMVSVGAWSDNGLFINLGYMQESDAKTLPYDCPYS